MRPSNGLSLCSLGFYSKGERWTIRKVTGWWALSVVYSRFSPYSLTGARASGQLQTRSFPIHRTGSSPAIAWTTTRSSCCALYIHRARAEGKTLHVFFCDMNQRIFVYRHRTVDEKIINCNLESVRNVFEGMAGRLDSVRIANDFSFRTLRESAPSIRRSGGRGGIHGASRERDTN